jgi:hypothetical protein
MPWGKGSITPEMATGLRCQDRPTGLRANATHTQIFYNLGMDRVHYVPQSGILHFVNSEHFRVLEIIETVYLGLGATPRIEQLFLDEHGYYKGALMLTMSSGEIEAILVALRLKDIKISIASD